MKLSTRSRGHRRWLIAGLVVLAALIYRYTNLLGQWTEDLDEFGYESDATQGNVSSLVGAVNGSSASQGAMYPIQLAKIESPEFPEDIDAMWDGVDELETGSTPPPPVARPFRPNLQTRPFPEGQEDSMGSVLNELASCTRLSCMIRVHDKIDGRTRFNFPHFFLLGYPHSGQQPLLRFLNRHSELDGSVPLNGSSWFHACQTEDKIGCNVASEAEYIQTYLNAKKAAKRGLDFVTLDASSDYISAGGPLARKMYRYFPWLKIVMIIRDPISRVLAKITRQNDDGSIYHLCAEKRQLLGCIQDYLESGDGSYAEAIEGWLTTFPSDQIHLIQWEELLEAPDKVLFDLKYYLGMDVGELVGKFSMRGVPRTKATLRKGQYMRLMRQIEPEVSTTLSLLQSHGVGVSKRAWLSKWESGWQRVLSSCTEQDECTLDRIELIDLA